MDCSLAVWSMTTFDLLVSTRTSAPVHDLRWDPSACNEFATVGSEGTLLFWLLDETTSSSSSSVSLNVHEAELPVEIRCRGKDVAELTSLEYGDDSTLYVGSNHGQISAWDTRRNTCFMHWDADSTEIGEFWRICMYLCS